MVMRCPKNKAPCFAIECCGSGECWIEQTERERAMGIKCPELGIYCYLKECADLGGCSMERRDTMAKAKAIVDNVFAGGEDLNKYGLAPESHICPIDDQKCSMVSCDKGQKCFVAANRKEKAPVLYGSAGTTTYKAPPPCHEGMRQLGWINKAELMIGRETAAKNWDQAVHGKIALIIGLLGDAYPQGDVVGMNDKAKTLGLQELLVSTPVVPNIWIKWPDYGIVRFNRAWWDRLLQIIGACDGAVLLYCYGGHGRSGTAAAILCSLAGLIPEGQDPVAWLRNKYCHQAVESDSQLDYIEEITGRKCVVAAAKSYTPTHYTGSKPTIHLSKKNIGGSGAKPVKQKTDPNKLSKRKWRAWWRKQPRTGEYAAIATVERPKDLPHGASFTVNGKDWRWDAVKGEFEQANGA